MYSSTSSVNSFCFSSVYYRHSVICIHGNLMCSDGILACIFTLNISNNIDLFDDWQKQILSWIFFWDRTQMFCQILIFFFQRINSSFNTNLFNNIHITTEFSWNSYWSTTARAISSTQWTSNVSRYIFVLLPLSTSPIINFVFFGKYSSSTACRRCQHYCRNRPVLITCMTHVHLPVKMTMHGRMTDDIFSALFFRGLAWLFPILITHHHFLVGK